MLKLQSKQQERGKRSFLGNEVYANSLSSFMDLLCNHHIWRFEKTLSLIVSAHLFLLVQITAMEIERDDGAKDKVQKKITSDNTDEERITAARKNNGDISNDFKYATTAVIVEKGEGDYLANPSMNQHSASDEDKKIEEAQRVLEELKEDQKKPLEERVFTRERLTSIQEYWMEEWSRREDALRLDQAYGRLVASRQGEQFIKIQPLRNVALMAGYYLEKLPCDETIRATRIARSPLKGEKDDTNNKERERSFGSDEYETFTRSSKSQKSSRLTSLRPSRFSLRSSIISLLPGWKRTSPMKNSKIAIAALDAEEGASWKAANAKKKKQDAIPFLEGNFKKADSN